MKRGSFIFDGVNSESLNLFIQNRPILEAPLRKVEWRSVYGVSGEIPFDEGAYNNTNLELLMFIDGKDLIGDRQKVYNLLDSRGVYKDLIPYFDPDKIYRVMLNDKLSFHNEHSFGQRQALLAKFTVKPYKYLINNDTIRILGNRGVVINPTNYASQPIIKVKGSGPVTLTINGFEFKIKDVLDTITLSSERQVAYHEYASGVLAPMNHLITTRDYPVLKPGSNNISVTGNVMQLYIEPRWRSLV